MSDSDTLPPADDQRVVDLKQALEERYLSYALSTITQRALPDARDGLKPVHRRIIHAMRLLKLDPGQGYKKRSEEHTSELQSLMRISYAVFCLKKKKNKKHKRKQ